ncbi:MAG: replicative DNA helicase [Chloroflexi bacterium]|nr:replicative DNA helicase [Chloroflexota bacterium]
MYAEKIPPHDLEAEEAVLGSLLVDGESIVKVAHFLRPEDFYREKNRWCYEGCLALFQRGEAVDQATIGHELARQNRLEEVGGYAHLSRLVAAVPTSVHVEHYARIVSRTAIMRRLIQAASEIAAIGYEGAADVETALNRAEDTLFRLRAGRFTRDFAHLREVLDQFLEESASAAFAGPLERGTAPVLTNLGPLDQLLGGLQRSDLAILAARPSLGKSALALNIAHNAAATYGATVAFFSLEMSREQLALRLLSSATNINSHQLRRHLYTEAEERRLVDAVGRLSSLPFYLDDTPLMSIVEVRSKARRLHMEHGVDLIVLDYLQLLQGTNGRGENRVQEISEISRSLKALARDLNVVVLAVSQLSRAVELRPSHRPMLSDLRESGSIEQDADVVMFIYREDYYVTEQEWMQRFPDREFPRNTAEIIVAKHRHGPVGTVQLHFDNRVATFSALPPAPEEG